jgi:hypothetical protein
MKSLKPDGSYSILPLVELDKSNLPTLCELGASVVRIPLCELCASVVNLDSELKGWRCWKFC